MTSQVFVSTKARKQFVNFHDGRVFHFGPVALEFGPAVQKDCPDAPNSKLLIGFWLVNSLACHIFRNRAEHGGNFQFFRDVRNSRETSR